MTDVVLPWTGLVGREREVGLLADTLPSSPLTAVVGPGGVGKTRVAMAAAKLAGSHFPDDTVTVWLAPVRDPDVLLDEISAGLGLPRTGGVASDRALVEWLADRKLLVVLDNCEHLLAELAPLVGSLVSRLPGLRVLATSREPFLVPGEVVFALGPLPVPDPSAPPAIVASCPSVRLFMERLVARDPELVTSEAGDEQDKQLALIGEICRRLDGLPLALELGAAQVAALGLPRLVERLAAGAPLSDYRIRSAERRHASLRSVFEWSEALLDAEEQALLRRLSVFAGGFDLASLEGVLGSAGAGTDRPVDGPLVRLVEKSLVVRDHAADRYVVLETIRQMSAERLEASGEADRYRDAHATWFLRLGAEAGAGLSSGPERPWLARLAADEDNLRVALRRAIVGGDATTALATAASLPLFWWSRALHREGFGWLEQALGAAVEAPAALRAAGLFAMGFLWAHDTDDWGRASVHLDRGIELVAEEQPVPAILGYLLCLRGESHAFHGHHDEAVALTRRGMAIIEQFPDPWGLAFAVWNVGFALQGAGDLEGARGCYERMIQIQHIHGSRLELMIGYNSLGEMAEQRGDLADARSLFERALAMRRDLGADRLGYVHGSLPRSLLAVARTAAALGDQAAARSALDEVRPLAERLHDDQTVLACRQLAARLGQDAAAAVLARDGDGWSVAWNGTGYHLADTKGLRHLRELLGRPHRAVPAATLAALADGRPTDRGDAGPVLDDQALHSYRRRLRELAEQADRADATGDQDRAESAERERSAILAELSRATGLGGRARRAGSAAERARLNVTRTIRDAIGRLGEHCPEMATHLDSSIGTGSMCVYEPDIEVHWQLDRSGDSAGTT